MNELDAAHRLCAALPGSERTYPFGEQVAVYKVGGKMFALLTEEADPTSATLKLPPADGMALREQFPGHVLPGYHLNKLHWNTVILDGTVEEFPDLVRQSYDLVVTGLPRRLRPE